MESNPRDRLSSLFQKQEQGGGGAQAQGNDALRYVAPREPVRQQATQPPVAAASTSPASTIIYNTNVTLYQYDQSTRRYVQKGDTATNNMSVGCVIVGSQVTYSLLLYNFSKQHLVVTPVTFASLKLTPQAKNYVNFYDDKQTNWSVKCTSEQQVEELLRHVFLTKIHVEIWSGDKNSVTRTNPNVLLKEDLNFVAPDTSAAPVKEGDMVGVEFSCWRIVGNATASPSDIVTKYQPFEKTSGDGKNLRKIRLGEGNERIKALEEGVVGMRKNGKRIILAPPPKTNGQDWYLIQVELVKTKTSSSSSSATPRASKRSSMDPQAQVHEAAVHSSRRRQTEGERRSSSSNSQRHQRDVEDLVVYEEDPKSSAEAELELKELRLLHRQKQLEIEQKALEQARRKTTRAGDGAAGITENGIGGVGVGLSGVNMPTIPGYLGSMAPQAMQNQSMMSLLYPQANNTLGGRPLEASVADLHAKIDYLIRISPNGTSGSNLSIGTSLNVATDAAAVIRGVERIANENERLLGQLSSQTQQFVGYEKRCDELTKQIRQLQEDKQQTDSRYQQISTQQMHWQQELANATQARDAAVTQMNRLHTEYQQLLNAFYQKQQNASENEQQLHALNYERESRLRMETELKKEVQRRSMLEQEFQILKKQQDVAQRLKDSELAAQRHDLETKLALFQTNSAKDFDTLRQQYNTAQQKVDAATQEKKELEARASQMAQDMDELVTQVTELTTSNEELKRQVEGLQDANQQLEGSLKSNAFAIEEKRLLEEQIELLEAKVKNLELEQSSPSTATSIATPHVDDTMLDALNSELTRLQEQNAQLQSQLETATAKAATNASTSTGGGDSMAKMWHEWTQLLKENATELFFQFQDIFEGQMEDTMETKQVLKIVRKVLKQNTKQMMARLDQEQQHMGSGGMVAAETDEAEAEEVAEQMKPHATDAVTTAAASVATMAATTVAASFVADESFSASLPSLPLQQAASANASDLPEELEDQEPPVPSPASAQHEGDNDKEANGTSETNTKPATTASTSTPASDAPEQKPKDQDDHDKAGVADDDMLFGASSVVMAKANAKAPGPTQDQVSSDDEEDEWSS